MRIVSTLSLAALFVASACVSPAQQMPGMSMPDMHLVPPPEQMPVPLRMTGLGNAHIAITATPEAQAWFDQGLNLYHDFWDYESTKAFEQGIRVDPNCAMCFWGLAKVEGFRGGPEAVYGRLALKQAMALKNKVSPAEKLYIEATVKEMKDKKDKAKEVPTLRKLVKKYPQDLQARVFLAEALMDGYDKGEPKAGTQQGIAILEGVLKDAPNDSAANHYWIHAMEPSSHPERAIPSSALLASLAPTSGHMVHMPGHIFYRTGNYAEADRWFAASTLADEHYMQTQHVGPDDDWNYVHNMMYAIANLIEQGRLVEANALSDRLAGAQGKLSATLYIWSARDSMARLSKRLPVALRLADWDTVLALLNDQTPQAKENLTFLSAELRHFATGMRALDQNQIPAAQAALTAMETGLDTMNKKNQPAAGPAKKEKKKKDEPAPMIPVLPDAQAAPLLKSLTLDSLELKAGILAAQGKLDEAKKVYVTAQQKENELGYREPPFYIRPVAEAQAVALLRAKDYADATTAYQAALVERPNSGFELYGLARVKELAGDPAAARAGYAAFLKAWPAADAAMPEVQHAQSYLNGKA